MAVDVSGAVQAISDAVLAVGSVGVASVIVDVGIRAYGWIADEIASFRRYRGGFDDV